MDEKTRSRQKILIDAGYFALVLGLYILFFRVIIYKILPFFTAILVAWLLNKPTAAVARSLHISRRGISAVFVLIFYVAIGTLFSLTIARIIWLAGKWAEGIPDWYNKVLMPFINRAFDWYENAAAALDPEIASYLDEMSGEFLGKGFEVANAFAAEALKITKNIAVSAPMTIVGVVICIIASFLIAADFPAIKHFFMAQLSDKSKEVAAKAGEYLGKSFRRIVGSYCLIILITFTELYIGFSIFGIRNGFRIAAFTAVLDIFPVVGSGTVLIPWAVINLVMKNYTLGLELLILYVVIYVIRQFLEPKIVGKQVGLSPVLVLGSIFLGVMLLGPMGLITLPLTLIVVKDLNDNGYIHLFKSDYLGEKSEEKGKEKTEA